MTSDRYFTLREGGLQQEFEQEYWGIVEDPDGNIRDRRAERERFMEDAAEEIAFFIARRKETRISNCRAMFSPTSRASRSGLSIDLMSRKTSLPVTCCSSSRS